MKPYVPTHNKGMQQQQPRFSQAESKREREREKWKLLGVAIYEGTTARDVSLSAFAFCALLLSVYISVRGMHRQERGWGKKGIFSCDERIGSFGRCEVTKERRARDVLCRLWSYWHDHRRVRLWAIIMLSSYYSFLYTRYARKSRMSHLNCLAYAFLFIFPANSFF